METMIEKLGLFVADTFLPADELAAIRRAMASAEGEAATVLAPEGGHALRRDKRRAQELSMPDPIVHAVKTALERLRPALEQHFEVVLEGFEPPVFLAYGEGDFYVPHLDHEAHPAAKDRRISVVVFVNGERDGFEGGNLVFYGLLDGPRWEDVGLPLAPRTGRVVAFPASVLHEVQPVLQGRRYAIAAWFH